MWNAVVIEVPLLDMLGYEHMSAGASWVGEYRLRVGAGGARVPGFDLSLSTISSRTEIIPSH